jgi:hypothetical protein
MDLPVVHVVADLRCFALRIQETPELLERLCRLPLHKLANLLVLRDEVLLAIVL